MGRKSTLKPRKDNQEVIFRWAKELLPFALKNGLKALTTNQMAELLDCSKATIYAYSASKEELIATMVSFKLDELKSVIELLHRNNQSFKERCEKVLEELAIVLDPVSPIFLKELKNYHPPIWNKVNELLAVASQALQTFYSEGMEKGEFETYQPAVLWVTDQAMLSAISQPEFLEQHQLSIKEAIRDFIRLKFFGLLKS